ncbi:unnamed protein product [Camellia sinensis]
MVLRVFSMIHKSFELCEYSEGKLEHTFFSFLFGQLNIHLVINLYDSKGSSCKQKILYMQRKNARRVEDDYFFVPTSFICDIFVVLHMRTSDV